MQSVLLRKPLSGDFSALSILEKLEVTANIHDETLAIIFRKNISGITQRLGEIALRKDEDQEIDSISWAATAVIRSTDLENEVKDLRVKYEEQGKMIEKLNQQLESFIQAKIENDNSLLEKFRELLNAKKSKIRDLHRALGRVQGDPQNGKIPGVDFRTASTKPPGTAVKSHDTEEIPSHRSPAASRSAKRKAKGTRPTATGSVSTSDEEESFDKMSVDEKHVQAEVSTPERPDPSATEDEDEDNTDDDLDSAPVVSRPIEKQPVANPHDEAPTTPPKRRPTPPPRRELPFAAPARQPAANEATMTKTGSQTTNSTSATANRDDETSDDEL